MLSGAFVAGVLLVSLVSGPAQSAPHQPIDFYHSLHSGELKIACGYCHPTAETAAFAGMPSTQLCMSCHRVVSTYQPEIWKLRSYWEMDASIPWNRVTDLPAHVYFNHAAHTASGRMSCEPCHGRVESMALVKQVKPMTMGWCLDCHRKERASTECWSCHR